MPRLFHVSSSSNRASILAHGLDWTRMGPIRGIAGSTRPEADGIFLCSDAEVDWFVRMNNTGGPVDVWGVDGVDEADLIESSSGYRYLPAPIPAERLTLLQSMLPPPPDDEPSDASSAYQSSITIELDDGTVLRDAAVQPKPPRP